MKNYKGPASRLISTIFEDKLFSPSSASLPPSLVNSEGNLAWNNVSLDDSQKNAVEFSLRQNELAIVHGPPGTGKTTTVAEIILQTVKAGNKVLACAPSNVAVDNLLEKLVAYSSVRTIRLGHPTRMSHTIQNRSLDAILSCSDTQSIANDVRKELDAHLKQISTSRK